jgi:glycosyltransferase involved in cell wall biosynthesis
LRIGFCSPKKGTPWGGSEELWAETARELCKRGHDVGVSYPHFGQLHPRLAAIERAGGRIYRIHPRLKQLTKRVLGRDPSGWWLARFRPEFVVISLDTHHSNLADGGRCLRKRIPFGVLFQVANRQRWIAPRMLDRTREILLGAAACYFVSEDNRSIVEDQIAAPISRALIVDQAFGVSPDAEVEWPGDGPEWRLANVGRLHFPSKGQDIIIDLMRRDKWRGRPVTMAFWGKNNGGERHLREMIKIHGLEDSVSVAGYSRSIEEIWGNHHALLLPSRYEGHARVLLEAMVCRRPSVVTPVGRVPQLVDDGETGFVADAAEADLVDDALERAWKRRGEWRAMGELARRRVRERCSMKPVEDFADVVERTAGQRV